METINMMLNASEKDIPSMQEACTVQVGSIIAQAKCGVIAGWPGGAKSGGATIMLAGNCNGNMVTMEVLHTHFAQAAEAFNELYSFTNSGDAFVWVKIRYRPSTREFMVPGREGDFTKEYEIYYTDDFQDAVGTAREIFGDFGNGRYQLRFHVEVE